MKKKIVGLLASVAMVFATGSMFVSCNDYDEDFYAEIRSELQNQDATLRELLASQVDALQAQLNELKAAQEECKTNCTKRQAELQAAIDALTKALQDSDSATELRLNALDREIDGLKTEISYLKSQDELFTKSIGVLTEALDEIRAKEIENSNSIFVINNQITELYQKVAAAQALAQQAYDQAVKAAQQAGLNADEIKNLKDAQTQLNEKFELMQSAWDEKFQKLTATAENALAIATANQIQITNLKEEDEKINKKLSDLTKTVNENSLAITHLGHRCDDLENEVSELDKQLDNLTDRVAELEAAAAKVQGLIDAAVAALNEELSKKIDALNNRIDGVEKEMNDSFDALDLRVSDLEEAYSNLDTKINNEISRLQTEINSLVNKLTNALGQYISGIVLQASENMVTGSLNTPFGINSQVLALFYGEAATSDVVFPCFDEYACLVDAEMALTAEDEEILGGFNSIPGHFKAPMGTKLMKDGEGNAGTLYVTVNPSDVDFTNTTFDLVNSLDEKSAITLSPLAKSDKLIKFGYTRADNGLYEAKATLNVDDIDKVTMDFDAEKIREVVKNAFNSDEPFNITNTYMTVSDIFADILDASGVRATWNDGIKTHSVYSQYGVAATAIKPFSFAFLYGQEGYKLPHIDPLSELDMHLDDMALVEIDDDLQLVYTVDGVTYTSDAFDELIGQINERIAARFTNKINKLVQEIGDQANKNFNKYLDLVNGYIKRINNNNIVNRIYDIFENPNDYLQPCLVYEAESGVCCQVSNSMYVPSPFLLDGEGEQALRLVPTSFNAEFLAPAFKKFIAVTNVFSSDYTHSAQKYVIENSGDDTDKLCAEALELANGQENFNSVFDGRTDVAFVTDSKYAGLVYEIAYSALDYSGRVAGRKYYVKVK